VLGFATKIEKRNKPITNQSLFFSKNVKGSGFTYFCIIKTTTPISDKERKNTMAEDLKENWKKVGKNLASLGEDLGKSLINSVKAGVSAATKWAEGESEKEAEDQTDEPKDEK
jgi:hypothetical protein